MTFSRFDDDDDDDDDVYVYESGIALAPISPSRISS